MDGLERTDELIDIDAVGKRCVNCLILGAAPNEQAVVALRGPFDEHLDIAAAFEIMDDIRDTFPVEFAQARQIVRERQGLLDDADAEANRMVEDARAQAMTIASEQEIVRISQQQADQILADARELERQTRAGAEDYADEVFGHVEQSLDTLLSNVRRCRDRLNATSQLSR